MYRKDAWLQLRTMGESYYRNEASLMLNLIAEGCLWRSRTTREILIGRKAVLDYYYNLFTSNSKVNYRYRIIELKEKTNGFAKGTIGLLVRIYENEVYHSKLILLTLNNHGAIAVIDEDDPRDYKLKYYPLVWKEGVISYSKNDELYEEEIFEYCFKSMLHFFVKYRYKIIGVNHDMKAVPTLIAKKRKKIYVILLKACAGLGGDRLWPDIPNEEIRLLTEYAEKINGTTYVAVMNMYSKDKARKEALITLVGDKYKIEAYPLSRYEWVDGCVRHYLIG